MQKATVQSMSLSEASSKALSRLSGLPWPRPAPSPTASRSVLADRIVLSLRTGRLIGVPGMGPRDAETAVLGGCVSGPVLMTGKLMGVPGSGLRAMSNSL